jgi:hypothetical protein
MSAVFVVHAPPPVNPTITNLSIHPNSVLGGVSTTGTVTLTGPATSGGITVSLSSDNSFATVPQTVTVPEGATSVDFVVTTTLPPTAQMATISATHGNNTKTAVCQVRSN